MASNIYREKTLNAILFFAKETGFLNLTKLFKLLNFFDFDHFKQTGYPALGLEYFAFDWGPVPKKLWLQLKDGEVPDDFEGKIALVRKRDELGISRKEIEVKAKHGAEPDLSVFSPRERKILETLAFVYKEARAKDISEVSHSPGQPWKITRATLGPNQYIDYLLALDDKALVGREEAEQSLREHFEILRAFDIEPVK